MPGHLLDRELRAPEYAARTNLYAGNFRDIHCDHVHRDMPDEGRALPIDEHRGAIGEAARHTIAVAAGKNRNGRVALGAPRRAVTDALAARNPARGDDRGLKRHRGRKTEAARARTGEWRDAVERDAGAYPIAVRGACA